MVDNRGRGVCVVIQRKEAILTSWEREQELITPKRSIVMVGRVVDIHKQLSGGKCQEGGGREGGKHAKVTPV